MPNEVYQVLGLLISLGLLAYLVFCMPLAYRYSIKVKFIEDAWKVTCKVYLGNKLIGEKTWEYLSITEEERKIAEEWAKKIIKQYETQKG